MVLEKQLRLLLLQVPLLRLLLFLLQPLPLQGMIVNLPLLFLQRLPLFAVDPHA